jgi:hypothetical protein
VDSRAAQFMDRLSEEPLGGELAERLVVMEVADDLAAEAPEVAVALTWSLIRRFWPTGSCACKSCATGQTVSEARATYIPARLHTGLR